jgi:hypothetical protein
MGLEVICAIYVMTTGCVPYMEGGVFGAYRMQEATKKEILDGMPQKSIFHV